MYASFSGLKHAGDEQVASVPQCLSRGLFHRVSLVFDKTIADIPGACEIFEVSQSLGALFGVGDGRVILRGAADQIGERRSRVPDQGGSRKVIALANTIEHLLNNQKTFHAAMHARIAQSESKKEEGQKSRGGQNKGALISTGRRISALNFRCVVSSSGRSATKADRSSGFQSSAGRCRFVGDG